jgi:cyclopropane fatty-acyl-phospholipid synthase-like methyltransferase
MNSFDIAAGRFDRVVSIEMFEHMKNYQALMAGSPAG